MICYVFSFNISSSFYRRSRIFEYFHVCVKFAASDTLRFLNFKQHDCHDCDIKL